MVETGGFSLESSKMQNTDPQSPDLKAPQLEAQKDTGSEFHLQNNNPRQDQSLFMC